MYLGIGVDYLMNISIDSKKHAILKEINNIGIIPFLFKLNMMYLELDVKRAPQYMLNSRVYLVSDERKFTFPTDKPMGSFI